jgi:hypothetical protein
MTNLVAGGNGRGHIINWGPAMAQFDTTLRQREQQQQQEHTQADEQEEPWFFGQSSQVTQSVNDADRRAVALGLLSNTSNPTESQVQTAIRKALRLRLEDDDEVSYRSEEQRTAMESILYDD